MDLVELTVCPGSARIYRRKHPLQGGKVLEPVRVGVGFGEFRKPHRPNVAHSHHSQPGHPVHAAAADSLVQPVSQRGGLSAGADGVEKDALH